MWNGNNNNGYQANPGSNPPRYPPPPGFGSEPPFFPQSGSGFGMPVNPNSVNPGAPHHPGYAPSYPPPQGPPPSGFPNSGSFNAYPPLPPAPNNQFQMPNVGYQHPSGQPHGHYQPPSVPPPSTPYHPSAPQYKPPPGPPSYGQYPPPLGPPPQPGKPPHQNPPIQNMNIGGYQPSASGQYKPPHIPPPQGPPSIPGNRPNHPQQSTAPHMPSFERQFAGAQGSQFSYQYSQCNGKKKALCIGINYRGQQAELKGCINDAMNVKRFLCTIYGYKEGDIVMLVDDSKNPRQQPTANNIREAMRWLVRDAKPNDSLFFHFSGHGGQTKDHDGDEQDGYDEVIYPLDFKAVGHIVDDEMHEIMVKPLPAGCRLTCIFDCCHSGSSLDLPYMYSTEGKIKEPNMAADIGQGLLGIASSYAKKDMGGLIKGGLGILRAAGGGAQKAGEYQKKTRTSPADVISWSGCKDSQTSADTVEAGQATGAMSFAFTFVLTQNKNQTYQQLLNSVRDILKSKYSQKPQLAASHPIDTNAYFIC